MAGVMQLSQSSTNASLRIKTALSQMAIFRGAKIDVSTLKLYSARLEQEPVDDVIDAIEKLQDTPRGEGELALPEIGVLLAMTRAAGVARANRRSAHLKDLARWRCPSCNATRCGYIDTSDFATRYCHGIPTRPHKHGEMCGVAMVEIYRGVA